MFSGRDSVPYERGIGLCVAPALRRYDNEPPVERGAIVGGELTSGRTDNGTGVASDEFFAMGGVAVLNLRNGPAGKWQRDAHRDVMRFNPRTREAAKRMYPAGPFRGIPDHSRDFGPRLAGAAPVALLYRSRKRLRRAERLMTCRGGWRRMWRHRLQLFQPGEAVR